jgi:hypothetical protein
MFWPDGPGQVRPGCPCPDIPGKKKMHGVVMLESDYLVDKHNTYIFGVSIPLQDKQEVVHKDCRRYARI